MDESEELKEARKILQDISKSKHERYLAELREKYIMDQNAVRAAGYDKGLQQGMQQGLQQGMHKNKLQIAKKMKEKNIKISDIIEITELTKEDIEKL